MIPKIIHLCWLSGDAYPPLIQKCINSWKTVLPDYEIWLWDGKRFDINSSIWVKEAFSVKKYAFAADYIRCYALYHFGGIYLDSDVEVIKSFDDLLHLPYFVGKEQAGGFEAATMGFEKGHPFFKHMLDYYDGRHFKKEQKGGGMTKGRWHGYFEMWPKSISLSKRRHPLSSSMLRPMFYLCSRPITLARLSVLAAWAANLNMFSV